LQDDKDNGHRPDGYATRQKSGKVCIGANNTGKVGELYKSKGSVLEDKTTKTKPNGDKRNTTRDRAKRSEYSPKATGGQGESKTGQVDKGTR